MSETEAFERFQMFAPPRVNLEMVKNDLNRSIQPMKIEIRKDRSDVDGKIYWALVNTRGAQGSKLGSTLDEKHITFMQKLMREMLRRNGTCTEKTIHAVNKSGPGGRPLLKNSDIRQFQAFLLKEGIILAKNEGKGRSVVRRYYIAPRGQMELHGFINLEGARQCMQCKGLCVHGVLCSSRCKGKMHVHCYNAARQRAEERGRDLKCQVCSQVFYPERSSDYREEGNEAEEDTSSSRTHSPSVEQPSGSQT
mmetsp:Transcript_21232/g.33487  ORF Transcript_21232/g.33487 Transcript_21232/m.33487 type:complete len:251 (-) Transcript_21232:144-896(-)